MGGTISQETKEKASETVGLAKESAKGAYEDVTTRKSKLAGKYKLPEKKALDDNDFTYLMENTKKNKNEILKIFDKYNLNRENAEIDKQGFIKVYQELHPESEDHVKEVADHVFKAFDSENTGVLSFNEFLVAYALTNRSDMRKKLLYAFDLYDTTKNGFLQRNEVRDVVSGIFDINGCDKQDLIESTVKDMQYDQQDRVSKDEFINGLMKNQDVILSPSSLSS